MKPISIIPVAIVSLLLGQPCAHGFSAKPPAKVVVVCGSGGNNDVGPFVFKKLLEKKRFSPIALVQNKRDIAVLKNIGAADDQVMLCNILDKSTMHEAFQGAQKCVICSSANPKEKLAFKIKKVLRFITRRPRSPRPNELYYPKNKRPYEIDYLGQKNVVDESMRNKLQQVVLLGMMGGYRGSKQNDIGRKGPDDDVKNGNIIKWKRAAERYLMKRCFFTIIHAAPTLTNDKGGEREIIWDTDDALLRTNFRSIPKEDMAEVLVQALSREEAVGRSIDVSSRSTAQGGAGYTRDWLRFWSRPGNCVYPLDFDDKDFS